MYVITFANPKGGSGKTTSAMLLAEQIAIAGGTVGVLDCDPNQNIVQWAQMRQDEGRGAPFTIQPVPTEDEFLDAVDAFRGKVDYLIIDLEGTASQMVTYAISQSDLVLVPFEPTPMEARQAARAVQLARNVGRMANRNIPHALLLTRVNAAFQTSDEKDVRKETETGNVPVLKTAIVRRAAYTRIFREGLLLGELRDMFEAEVKDSTKSQKERTLKPIDSAIQNAMDYAQEVINQLEQKGLAA
ncbi:MAG: stability/partitioning determinant [Phyllobacteriaceae bacterium]|nr:stability/partitioning determinant [Phyllobacteriaceae bacterium]MBA89238.1 stability/partitioning determinant [Phyllobacteriaceae bacterium]|tara:strand:+ start:110 stop:841 length:732 start_codon:yes stop_codon:yes gene_type:complete